MSPTGFVLRQGMRAPRQSGVTSCGAACLVLARMLIDPPFAAWIEGGPGDGGPAADRWARAQREVRARTNAIGRYPGLLQAPWPASLGTPPWGARAELERNCSGPGVSYEVVLVRTLADSGRGEAFDATLARVGLAAPALVYVGSELMPRHIVLWAQPAERAHVVQYDPIDGSVSFPSRAHFVGRRMASAGWDMPWLVLRPDASERVPGGDWRAAFLPQTLTAAGGLSA